MPTYQAFGEFSGRQPERVDAAPVDGQAANLIRLRPQCESTGCYLPTDVYDKEVAVSANRPR